MTTEVTKRISYNRDGRDYDCYVSIDGDAEQYIGSAATYGQAEVKCNDHAIAYYEDAHTPEKAAELVMSNCLSRHVAAKTYPAFGRFLAEIEALGLPDQLTDAIVLPGAKLADELAAAIA
jgi:hypothetical protein